MNPNHSYYILRNLSYKAGLCLWSSLLHSCIAQLVLEKTLESPLDCNKIQPVHSEGDQPWDFFRRNDAKAETPVLWPPHAKSWLIGKDFDAERDWRQEKGTTEDEMAAWHHRLDGHDFEWTPGVRYGQGGLACCDSWGRKESDTTERLNWTDCIVEEGMATHSSILAWRIPIDRGAWQTRAQGVTKSCTQLSD